MIRLNFLYYNKISEGAIHLREPRLRYCILHNTTEYYSTKIRMICTHTHTDKLVPIKYRRCLGKYMNSNGYVHIRHTRSSSTDRLHKADVYEQYTPVQFRTAVSDSERISTFRRMRKIYSLNAPHEPDVYLQTNIYCNIVSGRLRREWSEGGRCRVRTAANDVTARSATAVADQWSEIYFVRTLEMVSSRRSCCVRCTLYK